MQHKTVTYVKSHHSVHALITSRPPDALERAEERGGPQEREGTTLRRLLVSWIQNLIKDKGPFLRKLEPSTKYSI